MEKGLLLRRAPAATQKMIAEEIGKSERTVKSMAKSLQERGLLARRHGREAGTWEPWRMRNSYNILSCNKLHKQPRTAVAVGFDWIDRYLHGLGVFREFLPWHRDIYHWRVFWQVFIEIREEEVFLVPEDDCI